MSVDSTIFTPVRIGPVTLRNRIIRSAAFENMAYGNKPSSDLMDYHVAVARGGVGMTTLAYASVNRSGLSFDGQLWMREEIVPDLRKITDAIHAEERRLPSSSLIPIQLMGIDVPCAVSKVSILFSSQQNEC